MLRNRFWAGTRLSITFVQFGGLEPEFALEVAKGRFFKKYYGFMYCNSNTRLLLSIVLGSINLVPESFS